MFGATSVWVGDTATAEQLFREGVAAMQKTDYVAACDAFAGSNEADPSPGTQMNLALCKEKQNKFADAWAWYTSASELASLKGQTDRAEKARLEAERLDKKLGRIIVDRSVPEGATVTRDGTTMPLATLGKEIRVDPGQHVVEVAAAGKKKWKATVTVNAGAVVRVDVPALEDDPNAKATAQTGSPSGFTPATDEPKASTQKTLGFVLGGTGILALIAAGGIQIFNIAAVDKDAKDINQQRTQFKCLDPATDQAAVTGAGITCAELNRSYDTKKQAAKDNQTLAFIVGGAGIALLGTGIVLVLTAKSPSSSRTGKPQIVPLMGPNLAGLGLSGSF